MLSTAPDELVLTFSGEISDLGVQFMVTGPEGRDVVQGTPTVDGVTVTQELADELVDGDYEVTWRVTSSDGHPISGAIPFTVEAEGAGSDDTPTTEAPTGPSTPTETPTGESTPTQDPTPSETAPAPTSTEAPADDPGDETEGTAATTDPAEPAGGIPAWGWLVAGLAALGLVACGFLAFRRN